MNSSFREAVESLEPKFRELVALPPHKRGNKLPDKGVYLFSDQGNPMYVGRSNNIRRRFGEHYRPSSGINKAAFAVLIAKKLLQIKTDYRSGKKLEENEEFVRAFTSAKQKVRSMEFRAIGEDDQTRQALLEIYCAVALKAPFNSFQTH